MAVERAEEFGSAVEAGPQRRLFDVRDYYRLAKLGILRRDERLELIEGDIVLKFRITPRRAYARMHLTRLIFQQCGDVAHPSVALPLRLSKWTELEPDLTLLKLQPHEQFPYLSAHPGPADAHLVIEAAHLGIRFVLGQKADLYARYGVPELWVLDLTQDRLLIHREPTADGYASVVELPRGESVSPIAFPDVSFTADEILGAPLPEGASTADLDDEAAGDQ